MLDGSGLSRADLVTADTTLQLLTYMNRHRFSVAFRDSLPVAGVDGTLRNRMKGTPAQGNVRAKTGTLGTATSLSGYVLSAAGERLVFSLMINNPPRDANPRADFTDAVAVLLASFAGTVLKHLMRFVKFHGYGNDYLVFEASELRAVGLSDGFERLDLGEPFPGLRAARLRPPFRRRVGRHRRGRASGRRRRGGLPPPHLQPRRRRGGDVRQRLALRRRVPPLQRALGGRGAALHDARRASSGTVCASAPPRAPSASRPRSAARASTAPPIPVLTPEPLAEVRDFPLQLPGGEIVRVTALQMCNPNCCAFVDDLERTDWRRLGRSIESHAAFPEHTNVEFVQVIDRQNIEARVWERGVGRDALVGDGRLRRGRRLDDRRPHRPKRRASRCPAGCSKSSGARTAKSF